MVTFVKFIIVCAYIIAVVSALPMGIRKRQLNGIQTNCKAGYFALTFDDGPYIYTDTLLTELDQQGIKVSFLQV
jgi:peptidoglycan/xylan/chitin deacetylase (PgdA/CDA1 family)